MKVWAYLGNHGDDRRYERAMHDMPESARQRVALGTNMLVPLRMAVMESIGVIKGWQGGRDSSSLCLHIGTRLSHGGKGVPIDNPDVIGADLLALRAAGVTHLSLDNAAAWDDEMVQDYLGTVTYAATRGAGMTVWPEANAHQPWINQLTDRSLVAYERWQKTLAEDPAGLKHRVDPSQLVVLFKQKSTEMADDVMSGEVKRVLLGGGIVWIAHHRRAVLESALKYAAEMGEAE